MRHYCSLADAAYLPKLVAMYESLRRHSSEDFLLHVLPMDGECRWILEAMALPNVELSYLEALETSYCLRKERARRTWTEYCWMMASVFTLDRIVGMNDITYLDADLFFFTDPAAVFKEIGARSIAITPHRLIPSKRYLEVNGMFNVGWVTFRNHGAGLHCLAEWAEDCLEWCFNSNEPMRFGDQKYLDAWPMRYKDEVCQLGIGVNVAPWNVGNWHVTEGPRVDGVPIVAFHMHEFLEKADGSFRLTNYDLRNEDIELIYRPYVEAYQEAKLRIAEAVMKLESERA